MDCSGCGVLGNLFFCLRPGEFATWRLLWYPVVDSSFSSIFSIKSLSALLEPLYSQWLLVSTTITCLISLLTKEILPPSRRTVFSIPTWNSYCQIYTRIENTWSSFVCIPWSDFSCSTLQTLLNSKCFLLMAFFPCINSPPKAFILNYYSHEILFNRFVHTLYSLLYFKYLISTSIPKSSWEFESVCTTNQHRHPYFLLAHLYFQSRYLNSFNTLSCEL